MMGEWVMVQTWVFWLLYFLAGYGVVALCKDIKKVKSALFP